jgi:hypothetical protein
LGDIMKRLLSAFACAVVVAAAIACGSSGSPTAPATPTIVNVGGVWTGTSRITGVTGGECIGAILQGQVGSTSASTLQVTQNGSSLTVRATDPASGAFTDYSGTAGRDTVTLNGTYSSIGLLLDVVCPNGAHRDVRWQVGTITATVNGNSASGTSADTYNVYVAGTQTGVGILIITSSFTMTR